MKKLIYSIKNKYPHSFYLGKFHNCYLGYSCDKKLRFGAASGGMVSAFLIHLLDNHHIDGAIISRIVTKNEVVEAETFIARNKDEVISGQSSIYMDFPLLRFIKRLNKLEGRFAIVALPCQLKLLEKLKDKFPWLNEKIVVKLGLLCGHASKKNLLIKTLSLKGIKEKDIVQFSFRKGHWRGHTHVLLKNGERMVFPFLHFGLYQNLYLHSPRRCLSCTDHFSELSDISFGDAWLRELKSLKIKHSLIVTRNERMSQIIEEIGNHSNVKIKEISPNIAINAQWRSLVYHKHNIAARKKLGFLFDYQISYDGPHKPRINDYIGALLYMIAIKGSESKRFEKVIFCIPRTLLYGYLMIAKLMINF